MKKYRAIATYTVWVETTIEAENEDDAWDIALEMDGGDFERMRGDELSDWHINDITEVTQ